MNDIFHKVSMTGDHSNSVSFLWDVSVLYLTGKENIGLCGLENSGEFRRDHIVKRGKKPVFPVTCVCSFLVSSGTQMSID